MVRLCSELWRGSHWVSGFPLPKPRVIFLSWKSALRDTGIPADLSLLVNGATCGRCCYPWQRDIFGNQGLEWKASIFSVSKEHPWFISHGVLHGVSGCDAKNSQRRVMGKKAIQWPGKAELQWRPPAASLHPRCLSRDLPEHFLGEK